MTVVEACRTEIDEVCITATIISTIRVERIGYASGSAYDAYLRLGRLLWFAIASVEDYIWLVFSTKSTNPLSSGYAIKDADRLNKTP